VTLKTPFFLKKKVEMRYNFRVNIDKRMRDAFFAKLRARNTSARVAQRINHVRRALSFAARGDVNAEETARLERLHISLQKTHARLVANGR
tara:strand:+ start:321 stop:593 length:273 start_codon:yes stop_codon:yes gene_type:complete